MSLFKKKPKGPGSGVYSKPEPKVLVVKNEENA